MPFSRHFAAVFLGSGQVETFENKKDGSNEARINIPERYVDAEIFDFSHIEQNGLSKGDIYKIKTT